MADVHRIVAEVAVGLTALTLAWSAALAVTHRTPGRFFVVNLAWTAIAIVATALVGLLIFVTSQGPRDPLHFLYGALAIAGVPVAIVVGARRPRQQAVVMIVASIVILILILRLFQTGA